MARQSGRRTPPLTVIQGSAGSIPGEASAPGAGESDWSALMARAQDGDGAAYRRLLRDIVPYLRALAARRLGDPHDIEDALQDILLTLHAVRHTYDPARPFAPWLVAIANRRLVDSLRRQGRRRARETPLVPRHETFAAGQPNILDEMSDRRELEAGLERLPPGQRQAVRLLKLEEKSLKEAASETGMSISALKVATHRALKALRANLSRRDGET